MVIYNDDVSFSFMTPEGHMFAGMITFSAEEEGSTVIQIQALIHASDPLMELAFRLGFGHKAEDVFWQQTLSSLAEHFGVENPTQTNVMVDPRIQWKEAKNIWKNAGIRSGLMMPKIMLKRIFGRN